MVKMAPVGCKVAGFGGAIVAMAIAASCRESRPLEDSVWTSSPGSISCADGSAGQLTLRLGAAEQYPACVSGAGYCFAGEGEACGCSFEFDDDANVGTTQVQAGADGIALKLTECGLGAFRDSQGTSGNGIVVMECRDDLKPDHLLCRALNTGCVDLSGCAECAATAVPCTAQGQDWQFTLEFSREDR